MKFEVVKNELLIRAYEEAIFEKRVAEANFNNADHQFIDVAIYQYNAAQEKVSVIVKQMKEEGVNYGNSINL